MSKLGNFVKRFENHWIVGYPASLFLDKTGFKQAQLKEDIEENYAKVDVYYKTLNVKKIRQLPAISVSIL